MNRSGRLLVLVATLALVGTGGVLAQDEEAPPPGSASTVIPAGEEPLGVPYGDWAARWWQWMTSSPLAVNPGEVDNCQENQGGEVFYIPHVVAGVTMETACEVGPDQWILATPGGTIWTNSDGETDEEILAGLNEWRGIYSNLRLTIDGEDVPDIDSYWVLSPVWESEYIEDDILGGEPGTVARMAAGGWFVMIPPLEPGSHTVAVYDELIAEPGDTNPPVAAELIANITVPAAE